MRTPENVLERAYLEGIAAARRHGFRKTFSVQRADNIHSGYSHTLAGFTRTITGCLGQEDLGGDCIPEGISLGVSGLMFYEADDYGNGPITVNAATMLTNGRDSVGVVYGLRKTLNDITPDAVVLRLGINPGVVSERLDKVVTLARMFQASNSQRIAEGLAVELVGYNRLGMIDIESTHAPRIPGIHSFDMVLHDPRYEVMVRTILEEPFFQNEQNQRFAVAAIRQPNFILV